MNTNNVISADAADDLTGKEYHVVSLDTDGVELAASGDSAPVRILGTLLRAQVHQEDGVYAGKPVAVQLKAGSIHYATIGASTATITKGAGLIIDSANPGRLVPSESNSVAFAWEASTVANGGVIRVVFL